MAVPLVVVGHGPRATLFQRQCGLSEVQRLYHALFIKRQDDGVGARIDIEPDDVALFVDKARVVGELELTNPVLEPVRAPDEMNRTHAELRRLRHQGSGPMDCFPRWFAQMSGVIR